MGRNEPLVLVGLRERHPDYVKRNRERQREGDARRRVPSVLAKSDAWAPETGVPSGIYRLSRVTGDELAKSDAWMVRIKTLRSDGMILQREDVIALGRGSAYCAGHGDE